ncbi:MAG: TlpA family protein disulfide reductase [Bdellovibrionaceae bacterium]|nr:TlpA family protein disulfide reductase [Pseudobdellovibrionaceae bacterium]MBX3032404.1 TlpA family protein disulfide reductase [Pseudobdellovibrionaceae bacterium]
MTSWKSHLLALGAIVLIGGMAAAALTIWRQQQATQSPVEGRALEALPEFTLQTIDGRQVTAPDYKGKILIVNFWASWCGPCVEEVPSFVRLSKIMGDDLRVLALSNDALKEDIDVFLKSFPEFKGPGFDIVHDGGHGLAMTKLFKVYRLPESFVFDPQGRLARKVTGTINWSSEDAVSYLQSLRKSANAGQTGPSL